MLVYALAVSAGLPNLRNTPVVGELSCAADQVSPTALADCTPTVAQPAVAAGLKTKTNTVAQASMKLGEAMYKQQAEADAKKDAAKDDVVDAEFTEVDDDKKKSA